MARYKHTDAVDGQGMFLTVNLKNQILPETFEYMLNDLIGKKIDVNIFDENYKNDKTGSKAIPPAVLLKLIIYGYSKGMISSRKLMSLGEENIIAKALTNNMEPHWTTIANFISNNSEKFQKVFIEVLTYCTELNLIGGETFAIDGCRLPSNASMEMSGTEQELAKKLETYRRMAEKHIAKHRKLDEGEATDHETARRYEERQTIINRQIEKISGFLQSMEKKIGKQAEERKSNVTDNESALIKSSSGFLQGYIGIAVSDKENQIIISAEAVGSSNEGEHLPKILDETVGNMEEASVKIPEGKRLTVLMDNDYYSEENLAACLDREIEAIIPDDQYRKRVGGKLEDRYDIYEFKYHDEENYYICPNGKKLRHRRTIFLKGRYYDEYIASSTDCNSCPQYIKCIRIKKQTHDIDMKRSLLISTKKETGNLCAQMRKKLNTQEYQNKYASRMQIIEPVFANIKYCKGMDRFTLRGKKKVNGQWKLYCIVHNLGKCLGGYNDKMRKIA
jgi:transposase